MPEKTSQTQLVNTPHPPTPTQSPTTLSDHTEPVEPLLTRRRPATDIPLLGTERITETARATGAIAPTAAAVSGCVIDGYGSCRRRSWCWRRGGRGGARSSVVVVVVGVLDVLSGV